MSTTTPDPDHAEGATRRDFLYIATGAFTAVGAALATWPFIDQMNPTADVLALASIEVDIAPIEPGQAITVKWRGKPAFLRYRTQKEIDQARADDGAELPDPQNDADRVQKPEWLIMVGVCTHLGCVPHYDTSGRIRLGPAPTNLEVPQYAFLDDTTVKLG